MAQKEELIPPSSVRRVIDALPTSNLALQGWRFFDQDGSRRPGVKVSIMMRPPSGGDSIGIETVFWGTGSPRAAIFFFEEPVKVPMRGFWGDDPWRFFEELWRLHATLRC